MMETVATSYNAPVKFYMPRISTSYPVSNCSVLGLGDVAIPGLYIGFIVKFGKAIGTSHYKYVALYSYAIGLVLCGLVLNIWGIAQPAMLYVVPCLLLRTMGLACLRGEY